MNLNLKTCCRVDLPFCTPWIGNVSDESLSSRVIFYFPFTFPGMFENTLSGLFPSAVESSSTVPDAWLSSLSERLYLVIFSIVSSLRFSWLWLQYVFKHVKLTCLTFITVRGALEPVLKLNILFYTGIWGRWLLSFSLFLPFDVPC